MGNIYCNVIMQVKPVEVNVHMVLRVRYHYLAGELVQTPLLSEDILLITNLSDLQPTLKGSDLPSLM